jgi:rhamnose transport system ATP-binding protein
MQMGIGYLPEDRQKQGLILSWSIEKNITLANLDRFAPGLAIREAEERQTAERLAQLVSSNARAWTTGQLPVRRQPAEGDRRQVADGRP